MHVTTLKELDKVAEFFKKGYRISILTGAGISAKSGIPTFRGKGGIWDRYDPNEVGTAEALKLRPEKVWEMHNDLRQTIASCKPNPAHFAIADLENIFENVTVITQNVDNYHQDAGSTQVLELHGNAWRVKCIKENKSWIDHELSYETLPPKCKCGAMLRPDVVFFNEPLNNEVIDTAFSEAARANIIMVIGTSCVVYPAAYIPILAKQTGAKLIEFNIELTPISGYADVSVLGDATHTVPELIRKIRIKFEK
jgi:NAD-dependent deacetylase